MLFSEWERRFEAWKAACEKERKWSRHLESLRNDLNKQQSELRHWERTLTDKNQDVRKLSGMSWSSLFHSFLGNKQDRLMQAHQEVVAAKLKFDEAAESVEDITQEIGVLERELQSLGNLDDEYNQLIEEKEKLIHDNDSALSEELYELINQKEEAKAYAKEVKEALEAGETVLQVLKRAENRVQSARNWGAFDMMGGGMIATAIKHNRMNEVKELIHEAQRRMRSFQQELKDIEMHIHVQFDMSGMLTFADFFFDGLIVDWIVQGKIRKTQEQISSQIGKVTSILSRLRSESAQWEQKQESLKRQYTAMVENAR